MTTTTFGPIRLRLAPDLSEIISGAWLPYTTDIAGELHLVQKASQDRLGLITAIDVNWRDFERFAGLDAEDSPQTLPLMSVTATYVSATLLVIPPRTSSPLAASLLRRAGHLEDSARSTHSHLTRNAARIFQRAASQHLAALQHMADTDERRRPEDSGRRR